MADYKNIPVEEETYQRLVQLCRAYGRKQGAQIRVMVDHEYEKLALVKLPAKVDLTPSPFPNGKGSKAKA